MENDFNEVQKDIEHKANKKQKRKKSKAHVSGKSVFNIQEIMNKKDR